MNDFWSNFKRGPHDGCYAITFYIATDNKNKANVKLAATNINMKMHQLFSKERILVVHATNEQQKSLGT